MVLDQFDAFNKGDIERLVNNVTDDFKWFYLSSDSLMLEVEGKENFKASMKNYFADRIPGFSRIEEYAVDAGRVSFKEVISHRNKEGKEVESSALGIYEVRKGKISRAWYFL